MLGEVVSEVTGADYETYVRDEILLPLGMERTGFSYPQSTGDGAATGYHPCQNRSRRFSGRCCRGA